MYHFCNVAVFYKPFGTKCTYHTAHIYIMPYVNIFYQNNASYMFPRSIKRKRKRKPFSSEAFKLYTYISFMLTHSWDHITSTIECMCFLFNCLMWVVSAQCNCHEMTSSRHLCSFYSINWPKTHEIVLFKFCIYDDNISFLIKRLVLF